MFSAKVGEQVEAVRSGDRLALSRALTQVENDTPFGRSLLDGLYPDTGKAYLIGVTGSPGTGKSSLVNRLARLLRQPKDGSQPARVAIVAVDPTSPFTGGALLGDRVRMRDLAGDEGIFIRSMASRGALGGLARTTASVVQVLDAAGFEVILIETVGAGQAEVDIARLAHTTLVVEAPGLGDDIQAIKAGILEIADILVVNKADLEGVENTLRSLRSMLELAQPTRHWSLHQVEFDQPADENPESGVERWLAPVLPTICTQNKGIEELGKAIQDHKAYLIRSGEWQRRDHLRIKLEVELLIQAALLERWRTRVSDEKVQIVMEKLTNRLTSPFQAVRELIEVDESFFTPL
ncbi:MAG: methylmalonyl Co-A mutase-associated GTPase MeaB [Anaerolineaceae bacterium]